QYQIWRAEINYILVRDDLNFEGWNGVTGNKIPDTYVGPYQMVGTTSDVVYTDSTVVPGKRYMYYVLRSGQPRPSEQSNLVAFPLNTPALTFVQLLHEIDRMEERQSTLSGKRKYQTFRTQVISAKNAASICRIPDAIKYLKQWQAIAILQPDATDVDVLTSKLIRRLTLYSQLPQQVVSGEFCTY